MSRLRVFISHARQDKELADALRALLTETFGEAIAIDYSSDDAPGGGIRAGETWLEWIMTTVRRTDVCIAILTEDSANAPWVTWETGAVTGVAMGSETPSDRTTPTIRVVPLMFGIDVGRVPAPLQQHQAVSGDRQAGVRKLLFMLQERCGMAAGTQNFIDRSVATFVETVGAFMQRRSREHPYRLQAADVSAVHLLNCRQGLTLEPRDGEITNGARMECGPFTGDDHQRWLLYPVGVDTYRIATADGTKCLSVPNDSPNPGAPVILWDYEEHPSQHWTVTKASGSAALLSTVSLTNAARKLRVASDIRSNRIVLARPAYVTNQDWWMLLAGKF